MVLKAINKDKAYPILLNITCIFIMLQPIFDLLSYLHIRGHLPIGISTFGKPLIIGIVNIALVLLYKKQIWRCALTYGAYLILMIVHTLLLNNMLIETSVILHEIRFMINILYLLVCYHDMRILYEEAPDKEKIFSIFKKTLLITFGLYIFLYLLSVVTGTASMTYEYSDYLKKGFKGWMDSGQIFGHALCICLPFLFYTILNNKIKNRVLNIVSKLAIAFPVLVLCLIGTKVSYYIAIIVAVFQVVIELFFLVKDKKINHLVNSIICIVCAVACVLVYPITPVKINTDINNSVLLNTPDSNTIDQIIKVEIDKQSAYIPSIKDSEIGSSGSGSLAGNETNPNNPAGNNKLSEAQKNAEWTMKALSVLQQKYADGELHPSDMRNKQLVFSWEKFSFADLKYKLFGIGYVIHDDLAIERDVMCMLFCFGIVGFLIVLLRPILIWFKAVFSILRRPLKVKMSHLCLFEGFSMFFFISWYAGATFIYTTVAIFVALLMVLLNHGTAKSEISEK